MFLLLSRLTSNQSANPFHHTPNIMRIWHFAPSPPLASWSKPPSPLAWTMFNSLLPGPLASASVSLPPTFPSFLSQYSSQSDLVKNCQMRPFLCWMGHPPKASHLAQGTSSSSCADLQGSLQFVPSLASSPTTFSLAHSAFLAYLEPIKHTTQ